MIGISKLYCGTVEPSDALRYAPQANRKPIVVWNCTRRCNLHCRHCYSQSADQVAKGEMTTDEGFEFLEDLARFGAPVVLFSGGEPLMRPDLPDLAARAVELGLRAVLSTNGTLIDEEAAVRLKEAGLSYVGISLDGTRATHDRFRAAAGAHDLALRGLRNCQKAGVKVGLRFTITRGNVMDVPAIFDLAHDERVPRICFYHLVYSGRAALLMSEELDHATTRRTVDTIIECTAELHRSGSPTEVLTVDNHADGVYLYLRMLRERNPRAEAVRDLLRLNGGNSSGIGIACVSWDGAVHPDQFWRHATLGNVRARRFSEIWSDLSIPLLAKLRDRRRWLKGRCARCRFLDLCGGNFRVRAEAATGDLWAPDPACYLTDEEIGA